MYRRKFIKYGMLTASAGLLTPSFSMKTLKHETITPGEIIHANDAGEPFVHFWSKCVGSGRANLGLRQSWQEQLKAVKEFCGFEYCRFHGLFHDDMFVYREVNGDPAFNWQYVDDLFDHMLEIGIRPFVELSFMPEVLASTRNTTFWCKMHTSPPKDYGKWGQLVAGLAGHCIYRYGLDEVKHWYFEVWNEPDLHGFWDGSKSQYFELYKTSVNAIKKVHKDLRVGGPATSNFVPDARFAGEVEDKSKDLTFTVKDINTLRWHGVWIKDFLSYCERENLPVDFISTHPYPTDFAFNPETKEGGGRTREVDATMHDLQWLKKTLKDSAYSNAEIQLTEWSSSPSSRDPMHDALPTAAYIIKVNLDCIGLADSLSYWTFSDVFEEQGAGDSIFHGGFGMINYQGIVKPSFHAYRMLHALGDEILHKENGRIITRNSKTGKIIVLVYHYPSEMEEAVGGNVEEVMNMGQPKSFTMSLKDLPTDTAFEIETLDKDHGYALSEWKRMGSPEPPDLRQAKELRQTAMATKKEVSKTDNKGEFYWSRILNPWTCILIRQL